MVYLVNLCTCIHVRCWCFDRCIFVWRLPQDFAQNVETRRMKIADPVLVANGDGANARRGTFNIPKAHSTQFVHSHDSTDSTMTHLHVDTNANIPEPEKSPDYRFSIGQLPGWAKNRVRAWGGL